MFRSALLCTLAINVLAGRLFDPIRARILALGGARIARKVTIRPRASIWPMRNLRSIRIGYGTFINERARIAVGQAFVTIGANCQIGPNVSLECVGHGLRHDAIKGRGATHLPIVIGDRVWVGAGAIILGGVNIGDDAVIAAGAVVIADVAAGTIAGGVPARKLRNVLDD